MKNWKINFLILTAVLMFGLEAKAAQTFRADAEGSQQVPPNSSTAFGFATFELDDAGAEVFFTMTYQGLSANQTGVQIRSGLPGQTGAVVFTLSQSGPVNIGIFNGSFTVTPQQVADLRAGLWYLNINSTAFPNGELRGQIVVESPYIANLKGAQVVPSNASNGSGFAKLNVSKNGLRTIVNLNYNNLGSNSTTFTVNGPALPGASGTQIGTSEAGETSGDSFVMLFTTAAHAAAIRSGQAYIQLNSENFPNGEIRGQIKSANKFVDLTGDNRADVSVFRPSNGAWYRLSSENNSFAAMQWGAQNDTLTPADFDGDALTDIAVWRSGNFFVLRSADNTFQAVQFGATGDDARVVADWDGDAKADFAVYRAGASTAQPSFFYILGSFSGFQAIQWGLGGDSGLIGDFDGDKKNDAVIYRQNTGIFYVRRSSDGALQAQQLGNFASDSIFTSDFDGDGLSDFGAFRFTGAGAGTWFLQQSTAGSAILQWGTASDTAVPVDYDGDNKADLAVYRGGNWFVLQSSNGAFTATQFGAASDRPISTYLTR